VLMCECGLVVLDWRALRSVKNSFDVAGRDEGWLDLKAERSLHIESLSLLSCSPAHSHYSHVPSHINPLTEFDTMAVPCYSTTCSLYHVETSISPESTPSKKVGSTSFQTYREPPSTGLGPPWMHQD
jgi:hypothetical protein